jgi:ferredoxin
MKEKKVYMVSFSDFDVWVNELIKQSKVIGVQEKDGMFVYAPLKEAKSLRLDFDVTVLPPKAFLVPPNESIVKWNKEEGYNEVSADESQIIFGVHPYDIVAINQLDTLFNEDPFDPYFKARRDRTIIIACDIQKPSKNIFASCMGTAVVKDGFDLLVTKIGEGYLVESGSKKGEKLFSLCKSAKKATSEQLEQREMLWEENGSRFVKHKLNCKPEQLPEIFSRKSTETHPVWEEKAKLCFSCGSCNLVCPTCYCFDVQDDFSLDMKEVTRRRAWDGCLLKAFALVAGGHNFRKTRLERYRHRYYRKASYVPAKLGGKIACVGCGRCISACVAKIANPVEVFNSVMEKQDETREG